MSALTKRFLGAMLTTVAATSLNAQEPNEAIGRVQTVIEEAIAAGQTPGAVVLVGRGDEVLYFEAFGQRAVVPEAEPMTRDTVFDLASLTKVVATTTSIMQLVEQGRIRLRDRVGTFIPEFSRYGKEDVSIQHLLNHTSGLRPDLPLEDEFDGTEVAIERATREVLLAPPGERFVYSDINFFLLGEIVGRVSGQPLHEYAREHVFEPLGMSDTGFLPPDSLIPRIAPTEACPPLGWPCGGPGAVMLRGTVHDPTARRMDGVAGHAGLFSTARDLAIYSRMILGGGATDGVRILSPLTVAKMTSVATPAHLNERRGLGWDIDSRFSSNRGDLLPMGSFGHTGFTGTSLWLDPLTGTYIVFLSNRVHPDGSGDVVALRARVATLVAAAMEDVSADAARQRGATGTDFGAQGPGPARATAPVLTGIDRLRIEGFRRLRGQRVALLTNQTGRATDGRATVDLLAEAPEVDLVALFSPEHGIRGDRDGPVASARDERTGLPIHSLYGDGRRPLTAALEGLDAIVVDIQGIGTRFYTYMTTMAYVMEAAAERGISVVVLDRPNPIGGFEVEGPVQDEQAMGFTGYFPMPIRHGLTLGELARLFAAERKIDVKLDIVAMTGWNRDDWFDATGLTWIDPSPNMRNLTQAALYPGIGAIEGTNLSVGRGTDSPFERVGAPWIDGVELAAALNARGLDGVRFYPISFTPESSKYAGERCGGVYIIVTNREQLRPVRVGLELAAALHRLYGGTFEIETAARLFGSRETLERVAAGDDPAAISRSWVSGEAAWRRLSSQYLLYY
ncbi:MAG: exo-beta-N-acetylmuramidase NamZ domain-containing protein [Pseudomonadota bacterium]